MKDIDLYFLDSCQSKSELGLGHESLHWRENASEGWTPMYFEDIHFSYLSNFQLPIYPTIENGVTFYLYSVLLFPPIAISYLFIKIVD